MKLNDDLNLVSTLNDAELTWWKDTIKEFRQRLITDPKNYAIKIIEKKGINKKDLIKDCENNLSTLREEVWQEYLKDELIFHREVISHLIQTRDLPKKILHDIVDKEFLNEDLSLVSKEVVFKKISVIVGDCAGKIMPYLYELSLSTTQSRRSRAGKVFERIIETFFDIFEFPYSNQSALGNAAYNVKNLGKKVDLIVPDVESYISNRSKCAVITMKTSLRERWQEVAEELNRTNVPHIYLLTVDPNITVNTVTVMSQYNITLVLYKEDKKNKFSEFANVMNYEEFFSYEMPHIIGYWKENKQ